MDKAGRLIALGYLPKELPPEFTSRTLAASYKSILNAAQITKESRPEVLTLARGIHARRTLRITNPVAFVEQANIISDKWQEIGPKCQSKLSQSRPRFKQLKGSINQRATQAAGPNPRLPLQRLQVAAESRYILQTDFARFFSSIYTHSIPWALYGKSTAKQQKYIANTGNNLDKAIRRGQDLQTTGIPVSSDVSHIISELIGATIDNLAFARTPRGYRYIDDYFIGFNTEGDAIKGLERLAAAAREFEIELNYDKTRIRSTRENLENVGLDPVYDFHFADDRKISGKEVHRLFDLAFGLSRFEENALKYTIGILSRREISDSDWSTVESYLLRCIAINGNTVENVARELVAAAFRGAPLNRKRITKVFDGLIVDSITFRRDVELIWALWLYKQLSANVSRSVCRRLSNAESSPAIIVALDLEQSGSTSAKLDKAFWLQWITSSDLYQDHWLLAYEAYTKGWLTNNIDIIAGDLHFEKMRSDGVAFYEPQAVSNARSAVSAKMTAGADANIAPAQGSVDNGQPLPDGISAFLGKRRIEESLLQSIFSEVMSKRIETLRQFLGDTEEPDTEEVEDDEVYYEYY